MKHILTGGLLLALFPMSALAQLVPTFIDESGQLDVQTRMGSSSWSAGSVDVNGDGRMDIYQPGRLYLNTGGAFAASFESMGLDYVADRVFGAAWADVNDDGFPEAFESVLFASGSRLYNNHFGVRLTENEDVAGIAFPGLAQGASFADFNGDGVLDVFIGDDLGGSRLYFGVPDEHGLSTGRFEPSAQNAEFSAAVPKAYGLAVADYDNDGDLDLYIGACDQSNPAKSVNLLYRNNGDGTFQEVGQEAGLDDDLAAWGVVWLDYDRDGWLDVYVANMWVADGRKGFNRLFRNLGDGTFEEVGVAAGVAGTAKSQSFGTVAADFNNDGWVDLYSANSTGAANMYLNNGDGTFTDVYTEAGLLYQPEFGSPVPAPHQGVSTGDYNSDGWLDLFAGSNVEPLNRLLMNAGGTNGHLTLKLSQGAPNRDAIGARIALWAGGERQLRDITAGDGFVSQNHGLTAHFGLGDALSADSLIIIWPNGDRDVLTDVASNQSITVLKGAGIDAPPTAAEPLTLAWTEGSVELTWAEGFDALAAPIYTPVIVHPDGTVQAGNPTFETRATLPIQFATGGTFTWTVVTSDGTTIRRALTTQQVLLSGVSTADRLGVPDGFHIEAPYPNPARDRVTIPVQSDRARRVDLEIVDVLGRVVLADSKWVGAGRTEWSLGTGSLSAGRYLLRVVGETAATPLLVVPGMRL